MSSIHYQILFTLSKLDKRRIENEMIYTKITRKLFETNFNSKNSEVSVMRYSGLLNRKKGICENVMNYQSKKKSQPI